MKGIDRQFYQQATRDMCEHTQPWFDKSAAPAQLTPEQIARQEREYEILSALIRRQI